MHTLVSVQGYSGDVEQIHRLLPYYEHHGHSILILSPEDAPITKVGSHLCRAAGPRCYTGDLALVRQIIHMKVLLEYPFDFYFMNDSDSLCLSPKIPDYVYEEDVLWSNELSDAMVPRPPDYPWSKIACQPPYFCSRYVLERLTAVAERVPFDPQTPFIDWAWMAWSEAAGVPHKNFRDGCSWPTDGPDHRQVVLDAMESRDAVFLHAVKTQEALDAILACRKK
jgi:hypothetical protein